MVYVHKLRKALRNRDTKYILEGIIEMMKTIYTVESSEIEKAKDIRGRRDVSKRLIFYTIN